MHCACSSGLWFALVWVTSGAGVDAAVWFASGVARPMCVCSGFAWGCDPGMRLSLSVASLPYDLCDIGRPSWCGLITVALAGCTVGSAS
eukprot:360650-Chlamydomonas_euryale.AAC.2